MSWSCPFHSFQLPLPVPVILSVCPLHCPCVSRSFVASHFPTSPVVPIGFLVLCFPFIPPALPLFLFLFLSCPFQFPFVSLSFPLAFRSCRLPISSPFLALPCISPLLPRVFSRFSAKGGRKPKPAKSRQGDSILGPLFCDTGSPKTTFSGNYGAVRGGPTKPQKHCKHPRFILIEMFWFHVLFMGGGVGVTIQKNRYINK